jgi:hypothetical protein
VSQFTRAQLEAQSKNIVVRTERGNAVVRHDPKSLPRRLRVLLLAIDSAQPADLYIHTLRGFGDIADLMVEMLNLGLITLVSPAQKAAIPASQPPEIERYLGMDSNFDSRTAADVLYGITEPGSFDEMLRVLRQETPVDQPAPPPPPPPIPISEKLQKAQIESLFDLLEKTRGERRQLRSKLAKMQRMKTIIAQLQQDNDSLIRWVYGLGTACAALLVTLILVILRR